MSNPPTVFIPAAGLGKRLGALTANRPKALVEYQGKPLLQHLLDKLDSEGFSQIVINVHHHAQQIIDYVQEQTNCNIAISDESNLLLDTGGALIKALSLFNTEDILVHNVDIISSISLSSFCDIFKSNNSDAMLAVRNRHTLRKLLFEKETSRLCGWKNEETGEVKGCDKDTNALAFSGIHIIKTTLIKNMKEQFGSETPFSIIDGYLSVAPRSKILAYPHDNDIWQDMGKPQKN
ncbi:MAG: NTP transferase domain-containing protein [Bacteroidales bacterium]|jgi:NDP-sugar pyrophosphorylase family protein|nr:NTP transferase domain-containing protein [Bacteroidales bacterium]